MSLYLANCQSKRPIGVQYSQHVVLQVWKLSFDKCNHARKMIVNFFFISVHLWWIIISGVTILKICQKQCGRRALAHIKYKFNIYIFTFTYLYVCISFQFIRVYIKEKWVFLTKKIYFFKTVSMNHRTISVFRIMPPNILQKITKSMSLVFSMRLYYSPM